MITCLNECETFSTSWEKGGSVMRIVVSSRPSRKFRKALNNQRWSKKFTKAIQNAGIPVKHVRKVKELSHAD